MKRIIMLLVTLIIVLNVDGQKSNEETKLRFNEAYYYMNGINKPYYPSKAFNLMMGLANEGVPMAMNAVGIMYMKGIGVEANYADGLCWFEKAAAAGYYKAYYNLGLIYKYGYDVERSDTRALENYILGAGLGDPDCKYSVGYMYYKGLACQQDYKKALTMFFESATSGNTAASYMIGICYRNGYGIKRDENQALTWLEQSSKGGNYRATLELATPTPENHFEKGSIKSERYYDVKILDTYKTVMHNLTGNLIDGKYEGYLFTYDWSGEHIICQAPLKLELTSNGSIVKGLWLESDTNLAEINAVLKEKELTFVNAKFKRADHYHSDPIQWDFNSARFHLTQNDTLTSLTGNIQMFSPVTLEPEKPMYLSLVKTETGIKVKANEDTGKLIDNLCAFPNPFNGQIYISFNLNAGSDVSISVFTTSGKKIYQSELGNLNAGVNIHSIHLEVPDGIYIAKVSCGSVTQTALIVKQ